jgi:hypothetical protein
VLGGKWLIKGYYPHNTATEILSHPEREHRATVSQNEINPNSNSDWFGPSFERNPIPYPNVLMKGQ